MKDLLNPKPNSKPKGGPPCSRAVMSHPPKPFNLRDAGSVVKRVYDKHGFKSAQACRRSLMGSIRATSFEDGGVSDCPASTYPLVLKDAAAKVEALCSVDSAYNEVRDSEDRRRSSVDEARDLFVKNEVEGSA